MPSTLILTVTRDCNLRCSYCPTVKDGFPSLSVADARRAVDLFADRYGGGDLKLFGGEPLLVPEVVDAVLARAGARPEIERVYLSTNGLGLDEARLRAVQAHPKAILTLSLDGRPEDHRRWRRGLPGVPDSYAHVTALLPLLTTLPRVVVTQTIPPAGAERAFDNFAHLRDLGFRRFNLLPGYYLAWSTDQLAALNAAFTAIARACREAWAEGERLYLRNLFTWAPTPFFNTGVVVDSDGSIHASNLGLSASLDSLRERTRVGSLDDPPTPEALADASRQSWSLIQETLPPRVIDSTLAVDRALSRFVRGLLPHWAAYRTTRSAPEARA